MLPLYFHSELYVVPPKKNGITRHGTNHHLNTQTTALVRCLAELLISEHFGLLLLRLSIRFYFMRTNSTFFRAFDTKFMPPLFILIFSRLRDQTVTLTLQASVY